MLIACPTCGRLQFDMDTVVAEIERRLEDYDGPDRGLGPRLRRERDRRGPPRRLRHHRRQGHGDDLFQAASRSRRSRPSDLVDELFKEIDRYYAAGKKVVRDEADAAEAREWLAENEDATAMTPERLAAMEAEAADGRGRHRRWLGRRFTRA